MAQSTGRLLTLLEILQSGGTRTVRELAHRLDVDRRTVRRYVEQLRELEIPVESVRGRYGGYRLARHYRMPPLMLNDDEAVAVIWSLLVTEQSATSPATRAAFGSAAAKVRRVLPAALSDRLDAVRQTAALIEPMPTAVVPGDRHDETAPGLRDPEVLLAVAGAARARRPVSFDYVSGSGQSSFRRVQPYGIAAHHQRLYLAGYDMDKQARRTFRLDRMRHLKQMNGTFAAVPMTEVLDQVRGPLSTSPQRHDVSVLFAAGAEHVRQFMPELLVSIQAAQPPSPNTAPAAIDGWVRVVIRAERLEWVAQRIAAIDRPFVVECPAELNDTVVELAGRLLTRVSTDAPARRSSATGVGVGRTGAAQE